MPLLRKFRRYKLCNPLPCTILFWLMVFAFYSHYSTTIYSERSWPNHRQRDKKAQFGIDTQINHHNDDHDDKDADRIQRLHQVDTQSHDDNDDEKGKQIQHINAIPRIHKQSKVERNIQSHQQHKLILDRHDRQGSNKPHHQQQSRLGNNQTLNSLDSIIQKSSQNLKLLSDGQRDRSNTSQDSSKMPSLIHNNQTTNVSSRFHLLSRFQRYHQVINHSKRRNQGKIEYDKDRKEVNDSKTTIKNNPSLKNVIHRTVNDSRNKTKQSRNNISWLTNHDEPNDKEREGQEYGKTMLKVIKKNTVVRSNNATSLNAIRNSLSNTTINPDVLHVSNSFNQLSNNSLRNNQTLLHEKNHSRLNLFSNASSHNLNKIYSTDLVRIVFIILVAHNYARISCLSIFH